MKLPIQKLSQMKPRERLLLVGCGMLWLMVVLDQAVIRPWVRHSRELHREIEQKEHELQQAVRLLERADRVTAELQPYHAYLRPPAAADSQMAALLKEVEDLAKESRVRIAEIKPLGAETREGLIYYTLDVRFASRLDEWVDFMYLIETSPSLFDIARAELSVPPEEGQDQLNGYLRLASASWRAKEEPLHP